MVVYFITCSIYRYLQSKLISQLVSAFFVRSCYVATCHKSQHSDFGSRLRMFRTIGLRSFSMCYWSQCVQFLSTQDCCAPGITHTMSQHGTSLLGGRSLLCAPLLNTDKFTHTTPWVIVFIWQYFNQGRVHYTYVMVKFGFSVFPRPISVWDR